MENRPYRSIVGELMYIAIGTRPDIMYAVSHLSRFGANPGQMHWNALKHLLRYLKGTIDIKLVYYEGPMTIDAYCDADYAGDVDTRRSRSGFVFMMGGAPISWESRLQKSVAISTAEAEIIAASEATKEAISLRAILNEIGAIQDGPTHIRCDNQAAIAISQNPVDHGRTKHIEVRHFFVREKTQDKQVILEYVNTQENVADGFTKALDTTKHRLFLEGLGLVKVK